MSVPFRCFHLFEMERTDQGVCWLPFPAFVVYDGWVCFPAAAEDLPTPCTLPPWLPSTKHTPAHPCTRPRYSVSRWGVNALLLRLLDKLPAAESVTGRSCVVLVKENTAINVTAAKPPPPILPRTSISTALQNINEIVALVLWRKVKCCNNSTPHLFYCFY